MDSNHRRRKPADLQSAPFGHSGICPLFTQRTFLFRASCRIRTNDPEITNHVLWPTELKRLVQLYSRTLIELSGCKVRHLFLITKTFRLFFIFREVFLLLWSIVWIMRLRKHPRILQMYQSPSPQKTHRSKPRP